MDTLGMLVILGHLEKKETGSVLNPNKDLFLPLAYRQIKMCVYSRASSLVSLYCLCHMYCAHNVHHN